ncbi:MAG: DsbA family protein, partial [Candidatus Micrarchaeia archaeon]
MEEKKAEKHWQDAIYVLGIAIVLSALLVSASLYVSLSSLSDSIGAMKLSGPAAPAAAQQQAAPSPQAAQPQQAAPQAPQLQAGQIKLDGLPFKGGQDAKVVIVEYSDFQCPFCVRVFPTTQQILQEYGDKVKFYFKHFPLSFHQNAQKAAEAYECALDQRKGWEYHDTLFANSQADGTGLNVADLKKYAADLGLD